MKFSRLHLDEAKIEISEWPKIIKKQTCFDVIIWQAYTEAAEVSVARGPGRAAGLSLISLSVPLTRPDSGRTSQFASTVVAAGSA